MTDRQTFKLRYVGDRFNGARLPLDVLGDLPAFRDLIVAYAKSAWREANQERQRLPKGFDSSISFDLTAIDDGSAVPKLDWNRQEAQRLLPEIGDELGELVTESYDSFVKLVDNAGNGQFPSALSNEHIRALNKLGSALRESERIEFLDSTGSDGNVVYLDTRRRKNIITRVRATYESRFEGFGSLRGGVISDDSGGHGYISVSTAEHGILEITLDAERIKHEFDGNIGAKVQFSLNLELDNQDKLIRILEVYDIDLVDDQIVLHVKKSRDRLSELKSLQDGWHDGDGQAISDAAYQAAERLIQMRASAAKDFVIFPTLTGGISFEIQTAGWEYTVEFDAADGIEMYGIELEGSGEMDTERFGALGSDFLHVFDQRIFGGRS